MWNTVSSHNHFKNEGFLSSCFTTDEEIFVVLNPSEKNRVKECFLKKEWVRHQIWLLVAFKLHFWFFTTGPKHPKCWNWYPSFDYSIINTTKTIYSLFSYFSLLFKIQGDCSSVWWGLKFFSFQGGGGSAHIGTWNPLEYSPSPL